MVLHPIDWIIAFLCLSISFSSRAGVWKAVREEYVGVLRLGALRAVVVDRYIAGCDNVLERTPNLVANIVRTPRGGWQLAVVGIHGDRSR